jgi:hypothetical protein
MTSAAAAPEAAPMPEAVAAAWDTIFEHYRLCEYGKRCAVAWIKSIDKLRGCKA